MNWNLWLEPLLFAAGGLILGFFSDKLLLSWMKRLAKRTSSKIDDAMLRTLEGFVLLWFVLAGLYGTILTSPITANHAQILENVLRILFLASVTIAVSRIAVTLITHYGSRERGFLPSVTIFVNVARIFAFLVGFLVILHALGISVAPALAALGVGGLAVALALQDPLTNLFSGLQIVGSAQLAPGQYIRLSTGEEGYVTDITWRNTSIRTLTNNIILIPNSKLATNIITNFYQPDPEMAVIVDVSVSYQSDLEQVEKIAVEVGQEVLQNVDGGIRDFEPLVRYQRFGDFSIQLNVILRCKEYSYQGPVRNEFIKKLHTRFRKEGIDIPYPPVAGQPS